MPPKGQQQVLFSFHFDHVLTTNITLNGSVLLVIRFFGQYHYSKKKKRGENTKYWQGCGLMRTLYAAAGSVNRHEPFGSVWQPLPQLNMCILDTDQICAHTSQETHARMFVAALIVKNLKQLTCRWRSSRGYDLPADS